MRKRENDCFSKIEAQDVVVQIDGTNDSPRKGGGQRGNRNAFKTGRHTAKAKNNRAVLHEFRGRAKMLIAAVEAEITRRELVADGLKAND